MNTLSSITINQDIYGAVINHIYDNIESASPRSVILAGSFGSGKTTVIRKVCNQLKKDGKQIHWIDGRSLFNTAPLSSIVSSISPSIIFIDDIDFLFSRTRPIELLGLIDLALQSKSIFVGTTDSTDLISSYPTLPEGFFKEITIPPLDLNSLWDSLLSEEQKKRAAYLSEFLEPTIRHADEIYRIVKGRKGYDLLQLIERHSALYSDQYRQLSIYSQNILNNLAEDHSGLTMSELRQGTALTNNILSSYLRTLRDKGIISYEVISKGKTKYKISDILFRKWLISETLTKF